MKHIARKISVTATAALTAIIIYIAPPAHAEGWHVAEDATPAQDGWVIQAATTAEDGSIVSKDFFGYRGVVLSFGNEEECTDFLSDPDINARVMGQAEEMDSLLDPGFKVIVSCAPQG